MHVKLAVNVFTYVILLLWQHTRHLSFLLINKKLWTFSYSVVSNRLAFLNLPKRVKFRLLVVFFTLVICYRQHEQTRGRNTHGKIFDIGRSRFWRAYRRNPVYSNSFYLYQQTSKNKVWQWTSLWYIIFFLNKNNLLS